MWVKKERIGGSWIFSTKRGKWRKCTQNINVGMFKSNDLCDWRKIKRKMNRRLNCIEAPDMNATFFSSTQPRSNQEWWRVRALAIRGQIPEKAPREYSELSLRQLTSIRVSIQSLDETILPKCIRPLKLTSIIDAKKKRWILCLIQRWELFGFFFGIGERNKKKWKDET